MSQLLTGLLCGDQAALDTCMVFLGFRRSKLQRLAEPLIVQDEYEPLLRSTKQSHLPVALARMVTLRFMPSTRCSTE